MLKYKMKPLEEKPLGVQNFEWDNLIILDGCRYDAYQSLVDEDVGYRFTLGSSSPEYVRENYSNGNFENFVYVNANPWMDSEKFRKKTGREQDPKDVFKCFFNTIETDWDPDNGTVLPKPMIRDTLTARRLYPESKIVSHFMQPHHPFIGSGIADGGFHHKGKRNEHTSVWDQIEAGYLEPRKAWKAYKENIEFVIKELNEKLLPELEGKTVITADHGNMFGECGFYGHVGGLSHDGVRKVPLHEVQGDRVPLVSRDD